MKRALILVLLTLIVGLLGSIPAIAHGSADAPSAAVASSPGSSATNQLQAIAGTGFTYQGSLNDGASPANGQYDLTFTLFDALTAGNQVGTTVTMLNQTVTNGLFAVTLDFGTAAFQGDARWLQIAVRPNGGGSYTTLTPRQALTATPYAMSLVPGAVINAATGPGGIALNVNNSTGNSVAGFTGSATDSAIYGVNSNITSTLGVGIKGQGYYSATGVEGASVFGYGLYGHSFSSLGVLGTSQTSSGGYFLSGSGVGLYSTSTSNYGVQAVISSTSSAVFGQNTYLAGGAGVGGQFVSVNSYGVDAQSTTGSGVRGTSNGIGGSADGVLGNSPSGVGVYGSGGIGVEGNSPANVGVYGTGNLGVEGIATGASGVYGSSTGNDGVYGTTSAAGYSGIEGISTASAGFGVRGTSNGSGGDGVLGNSPAGVGVYGSGSTGIQGIATGGVGVYGSSTGNDGVFGTTSAGTHSGVTGISSSSVAGNGVYGTSATCANCYAGWFDGRVHATSCCSGPELNTQIDDPLDPVNKVLNQASVESPDRVNIYSGNVTTDAKGEAAVTLPQYASALGGDFRYQLTVIDQFSQAIISSKVKDNIFTIKTDKPNVEVSWQVTGVRHDPYATSHPMQPEESKPVTEQGK